MKNNKPLIIGGIVIALVVVGGLVWKFVLSEKALPVQEEEEVMLPQVDPSVEVAVAARSDKKAVTLRVANIPSDTESIEYELSYNTAEGLPKGALGKITLKGESSIEREILLGTCSRNVCRYDEGVTRIDLVLRFNSAKGASQFQKSYDL